MTSKSEFDDFAGEYSRHVSQALPPGVGEVDKFARIKVWHLVREIQRREVNATSILDVGCGIGITDSFLKCHHKNITGLDVSEKSLEIATSTNPELYYVHYDGAEFPFPERSFDVVFAMCVVHHVPPKQWESFFSNAFRVLKPGGMLAIYEHNPWNPLTRWVVAHCEFDRDAVLISAPECELQAHHAGFDSPCTRFILFAPFEGDGWSTLEERCLSRIPIGAQYQFSAIKNIE